MDPFTRMIIWLNVPANAIGALLAGLGRQLPGWLSNTIISAISGLLLLTVFKYTSNQAAIGRIRDRTTAAILAIRLFRDNIRIILKSQGKICLLTLASLFYAIVPILVMILPMSLLLSQMNLWYQWRPLAVGEETLLTVEIDRHPDQAWPNIRIQSTPGVEVITGPVRITDKAQVLWKIRATRTGYLSIPIEVNGQTLSKALAVGKGYMRISVMRPCARWLDVLMNPLEEPLRKGMAIESISIEYPERISKTSGTNWWAAYFFLISMISALLLKPLLRVRI